MGERKELLAWYVRHKSGPLENRHMLVAYCQDEITVLRQACHGCRYDSIRIGNIEVFFDCLTTASACIKLCGASF